MRVQQSFAADWSLIKRNYFSSSMKSFDINQLLVPHMGQGI